VNQPESFPITPGTWLDPSEEPSQGECGMALQDPLTDAVADFRPDRDQRERRIASVFARVVMMREEYVGLDDLPQIPLAAYEAVRDGPEPGAAIAPKAQRTSLFYSAATFKDKAVPPREWLVPDLVPQKTVTLLSCDGGTGKSLRALQLAIAVAACTRWIGKAVARGRMIYLSAEDDDEELHRRIDDILRATGRSCDDVQGLTLRSVAGEDALLAVETQVALIQSTLFEELDARASDENPALIVIDTLADVYPANENDRAEVRQFGGILRRLALNRKCAVMLLGHPSLTGLSSGSGTSGSTAWSNSVRSRLYFSRIASNGFENDPNACVLATKKANYAATNGEINLRNV